MPQQLTFDLPFRPALSREDFLVTASNEEAVAVVDQWPNWPSYGAIISGPPGSGKSHLASVWQQRSGADHLDAKILTKEDVPHLLSAGAIAVENVAVESTDEAALFHLLNFARQTKAHVLLTSTAAAVELTFKTPDLVSRLRSLPEARIQLPDDSLLRAVLVKLFADRQLAVDEPLIAFVLRRMPRSLDAAQQIVTALDAAALQSKRELTRFLASEVMSQMGWINAD